jgi:hypothetical protein
MPSPDYRASRAASAAHLRERRCGRDGGEIEVVGRDQGREAGMADEVEECVQHPVAGRLVEVAGRLVAEQDLGIRCFPRSSGYGSDLRRIQ